MSLLISHQLSTGGPIEQLLGAVLFVTTVAAVGLLVAGLIRQPGRLEIGPHGVAVAGHRRQLSMPWTDISRVGVTDGHHPALVLWAGSPAVHQGLRGRFPDHHGGFRLYRVAPGGAGAAGRPRRSRSGPR